MRNEKYSWNKIFIGLLDNLLLYPSLKNFDFNCLKSINNQLNIKKYNGGKEMIPFMAGKRLLEVQPGGRKSGHNNGLILRKVH